MCLAGIVGFYVVKSSDAARCQHHSQMTPTKCYLEKAGKIFERIYFFNSQNDSKIKDIKEQSCITRMEMKPYHRSKEVVK